MRNKDFYISLAIDILVLFLALYFSLILQWKAVSVDLTRDIVIFGLVVVSALLVSFKFFCVYKRIWEYAGITDFFSVMLAVTAAMAVTLLMTLVFLPRFSLRLVSFLWVVSVIQLGGVRFLRRLSWHYRSKSGGGGNKRKVLIIGAGEAGALIVRTLQSSKNGTWLEPICFIDDDLDKKDLRLYGLPVIGDRTAIPEVTARLHINEAIIAIPSATPEQIRSIALICRQAGLVPKVLPSVLDLVEGKQLLDQIEELKMEDLLHRTEVEVDLSHVKDYLKGQVILVSGAGGSIGSELCRQICTNEPSKLLLLGRGENSIHEVALELARNWPKINCIPIIADIRDQEGIETVFKQHKPGIIFHAAAHKHVHLMEMYPDEAFKNNVFGTLNMARLAQMYSASLFVQISTDKAVNPTSVMGLTKLLAEMIVRHYAGQSKTKFVSVRFGNVLGSRGSVIHLFNRQIASGGPVTVTHPEMRRYFMTINEAVQLVTQAGAMARGGETFVLDMGEQIKVVDLVKEMIELSGYRPLEDIEIKFTGIRPGEKLFEELFTEKEKAASTQHQKIFICESSVVDNELVQTILSVQGFPGSLQIKKLHKLAWKKMGRVNGQHKEMEE